MLNWRKVASIFLLISLLCCVVVFTGCSKEYDDATDDEAIAEMHSIHDAIGIQLGAEDTDSVTNLSLQHGVLTITVDFSRLERALTDEQKEEFIRKVDIGIKRGTQHNYYETALIKVVDGKTYNVSF